MSEKKWTPGPWVFDDENSVVDTEGYEVCWDATEPDAHLIAAAPTMADYIKSKADCGCEEAKRIWRVINAS